MAAPATAEARQAATEDKPWYCGYCITGTHELCPRAVRNGANARFILLICDCTEPTCGANAPRCLECKQATVEDLDTRNWRCLDMYACQARIQSRLDGNPLYQQLKEIRSIAMARVENEKAEKKATAKKEAAPKVGSCVHCGGETKGGKFLPGHDAAWVSENVALVLNGNEKEAPTRTKIAGISDSLAAKFDKSLGLAREKAAKKAADTKAKADAKAEAKAGKAEKATAAAAK